MMSEGRFNQIYQGMSSVAKKVYNVIPIAEAWTTNQVAAEVTRQGLSIEFPIMVGCINTLIRAKLVEEPEQRVFKRTPIRVRAVQEIVTTAHSFDEEEDNEDMANLKPIGNPAKPKDNPINRLGDLATRMQRMAKELEALAADVESAALDAAEEVTKLEASAQQFQQFKTLLKGLA
jgi:hypothetical protein